MGLWLVPTGLGFFVVGFLITTIVLLSSFFLANTGSDKASEIVSYFSSLTSRHLFTDIEISPLETDKLPKPTAHRLFDWPGVQKGCLCNGKPASLESCTVNSDCDLIEEQSPKQLFKWNGHQFVLRPQSYAFKGPDDTCPSGFDECSAFICSVSQITCPITALFIAPKNRDSGLPNVTIIELNETHDFVLQRSPSSSPLTHLLVEETIGLCISEDKPAKMETPLRQHPLTMFQRSSCSRLGSSSHDIAQASSQPLSSFLNESGVPMIKGLPSDTLALLLTRRLPALKASQPSCHYLKLRDLSARASAEYMELFHVVYYFFALTFIVGFIVAQIFFRKFKELQDSGYVIRQFQALLFHQRLVRTICAVLLLYLLVYTYLSFSGRMTAKEQNLKAILSLSDCFEDPALNRALEFLKSDAELGPVQILNRTALSIIPVSYTHLTLPTIYSV
eukprot:TRINITY_DN11964_c0_g2_i1.p1 TRINITY_DN11964_c0_g2~~TRINITY_DN11964_c0_g2_i1.p1  ORF type:complete len:448 (+),score=67.44 TRINITY_DN11964_c0_g2_i1:126-1469(+)